MAQSGKSPRDAAVAERQEQRPGTRHSRFRDRRSPVADRRDPKQLLEALPDATLLLDTTGRILAANRAAADLFGASPSELAGQPSSLMLMPVQRAVGDDRASHWVNGWADAASSHQAHARDLAGTSFPVEVRVRRITHHGTAGYSLTLHPARPSDGEESLRDQLVGILEETSDLVIMADADGQPVYYNKAGRSFRGITSKPDGADQRLEDVHPEWAVRRLVEEAIPYARQHGSWCGETAVLAPDGEEIPVSQVVISHSNPDGSPGGFSTITRDIRPMKLTEERLLTENRILEMIAEGSAPLDDILAALCRHLDDHSPPDRGHGVLVMEEDGFHLRLAAAPALSERARLWIGTRAVGPNETGCWAAAFHGHAVAAQASGRPAAASPWAGLADAGYNASFSLPLTDQSGEVLGTLTTYMSRPRELDEEERRLLESTGSLARLAISRRLYDARQSFLATHDSLTGLPNRALFLDRVERMLARARRDGGMVALMFLDLDHFKPVNDQFGHEIGDKALQTVAQRLRAHVRETDTIGRHGGDEFILVIGDLKDRDTAGAIADHLIETVHEPLEIAGQSCEVSASIGIGIFPDHGQDPASLLQAADEAMYVAKKSGRCRYAFARRRTPE